MVNDYKLSIDENIKEFQKEILPDLKEKYDFSQKENPKAYFTAGLPGAGKSKVIEQIELTKPDIIVIDADELRKEHPKAQEILNKHGAESSSITHPDAVKWVSQLKEEAFKHKADYVLDSSMRNPKSPEIEIGQALKNNYSVEVTMVAVNKYESLQGIYDRYANQYESNSKEARFVDPKLIEDANISIRDSAAVVDNLEVKQFKIVDRKMETVFDSTKDIKGTAKEKLEEHTNLRNWSPEKLDTLKQNFERVVQKLEDVKAPKEIIDSAKTTQNSLKTEIKDIQQSKISQKELYEKVKSFKESRPEATQDIQKSKGLQR